MKHLDIFTERDAPVIPLDLIVQKSAILARTGAGKSTAAADIAEEVLRHEQQVVVLDPKGDWWGLKSSTDGTEAGYPIYVFGGEHADVPLIPASGALVADLAAEGASMVIDLSEFSNAERNRFVVDFAETFYRAKAKHSDPVLLVLEEADEVCPQRVSGDNARMVGAIERIVKRGRFRGIGVLMVTQRSASLNKDILTQIEVLVVMQTTSPQDRKAIDEWVETHPDPEKLKALHDGMASLKQGEAFIWSPSWLDIFTRVRFRHRRTYDAGRTPRVGERRSPPKVLAQVDLTKLGERIAATVEQQKANDPATLKARIRQLEREKGQAPEREPKVITKRVLDDGQVLRIEKLLERAVGYAATLDGVADKFREAAQAISVEIASVRSAVSSTVQSSGRDAKPHQTDRRGFVGGTAVRAGSVGVRRETGKSTPPSSTPRESGGPARTTEGISGSQQAILNVVATIEHRGLEPSVDRIAAWRDLHPNGGRFRGDLRALIADGCLDSSYHLNGEVKDVRLIEPTFEPSQEAIIQVLLTGPRTVEELASRLNLHPNGGRFRGNLRRLVRMGLVAGPPYRVTEALR